MLVADPSMIGLAHNMAPGDQVTGMMDGAIGFATVIEEGDYSPGVILTPDGLHGNADTATLADEAKKLSSNNGDHGTPVYFDGGVPTECDEINIPINNESIVTESLEILYNDNSRISIGTDAGEPAIALRGDDNYIPVIAHAGFYGGALNGVMKFNDNGYHMAGAIRDYVVALDSDSVDNVVEGAVLSTDVIGFVQSTGFDANGDPIAIPNGAILTPDGLQGNATTANLADEAKSLTTKVSGSSSLPVYFDGGVPTPIDDLKDIGVIEADSIMIKGI